MNKEKNGNDTQGDYLEGVFLATNTDDKSEFINNLKKEKELENVEGSNMLYFRKKSIKKCYCVCFYGLNSNDFNEKNIDENGVVHYYARVSRQYFSGFSSIKNREEYERTNENKKSSVVFVYNPNLLFLKIKNKLIDEFNIDEKEIIISPVEYIDKKKNYVSMVPYPLELLFKDRKYNNQNEVRIIINTENEKFIEYMNNNNGNINIGSIQDFCHLYDYYFNDLVIEKIKKNEIIFNLPKPENQPIEKMSLSSLKNILMQIKKEDGDRCVKGNKADLIEYLEKLIKDKYGVFIDFDSKGNITITNASQSVFDMLGKGNYNSIMVSQFNNKIDELISENNYDAAILEMKKEVDNKILEESINYYIAKIYENKLDYIKAIEIYSQCIIKEMRVADSLSSRANCYSRIGMYDKAIDDLNQLQDTIGYNHQIYSNIGVNLINLGKMDEAISFFNKSIEINPINPFAFYNRGVAYYKMEKYDMFDEDLKKAIEYEPENISFQETYKRFSKS